MHIILLLTAIKYALEIVWKMHQLHKSDVDSSVKDEIDKAFDKLKSVVSTHHDNLKKGGQ